MRNRLLRLLRKERALMSSLTALSLSPSQAIDVLTHSAVASAQQSSVGGAVVDGLCDASDRAEGGGVIVWWNNLEKDKRCVKISTSYLDPTQYFYCSCSAMRIGAHISIPFVDSMNLIILSNVQSFSFSALRTQANSRASR